MRKRFALVLAALVLAVASGKDAWARTYFVERMDVDIEVQADGRVAVEERIHVRFNGRFNGIYRVIPFGINQAWGIRDIIALDVQSVTDPDGTGLQYWQERERGKVRLKVRVPGAHDATRIVIVRYVVQNVIRSHESKDEDFSIYDELYWNVTGNAWEVPIAQARARVKLPQGIEADEIQLSGYTGMYGGRSSDYDSHTAANGRVVLETTDALRPGEGFTISVAFPPGHVASPSLPKRTWWLLKANWMLLLPLLGLFFWIGRWWTRGRDVLDRSIIPEFKRPGGLPAAEAGVLIDDTMDPRDLSAAVVDLAVKGVITVVGAELREDMIFELNRDVLESAPLATWEEQLVNGIFKDDDSVTIKELQSRLPQKVGHMRERILGSVVKRGLYPESPHAERGLWLFLSILGLIVFFVVGMQTKAPPAYWALTAIAAVGMFIFSRYMPRRTRKGLDLLARLRGLEDYMRTAETERMKAVPLDTLESLIPYAVAFGIHERWAERLQELFEYNPGWYRRSGGAAWVDGMNMMDRGVQRGAHPPPRVQSSSNSPGGWGSGWGSGTYSGGSGWGGGGSVGGGFGGGGGGAW